MKPGTMVSCYLAISRLSVFCLSVLTQYTLILLLSLHFEPCDWSTQFIKVISLCLSFGSHWSQVS